MSHKIQPAPQLAGYSSQRSQRSDGVRTQMLLVLSMAAITLAVTTLCLLLIRHRLREQVTDDLSQDLVHSVITFQSLEAERLEALERENALLAELPTLKALMTSGDDLTIQDGATEFWQLSGDDLFALADPVGRIVAVYAKHAPPDAALRSALHTLVNSDGKQYLIDGRVLYACSVRPLYFGGDDGTLLGYVVSGVSIERTVREISAPTGVEATFINHGQIVASTLDAQAQSVLAGQLPDFAASPKSPIPVRLGKTRFLSAREDLSAASISPLQLVVLKSFEPAEKWISRIDRMVLSTGLFALLFGTVLMVTLSGLLTRPLEALSRSVHAFGMGDETQPVPRYGTREVRQLSKAFARMREEIQRANQAQIESERLATIGRMASSVSHDLRHYLAAVYANAEFLSSDALSTEERAEIFAEIRSAVLGTTDMIESLLIFSRSGTSTRRTPQSLAPVLERTVSLLRAHPDAHGVTLKITMSDPGNSSASIDEKQIERAVYNLLLNACQAGRANNVIPAVQLSLETLPDLMILTVTDNGAGVPHGITGSIFDPFVSEGKQKGTGLGLTLAQTISEEHGGRVTLLSSRPGETIFQMVITRWDSAGPVQVDTVLRTSTPASAPTSASVEASTHEKV